MAKIRNRRTIQGVVDELKLQREREAIPEEILTKIVPTFDVAEKGVLKVYQDLAPNDNDKSVTVPDGQEWEIDILSFNFITTATVGNRLMEVRITDADGNTYWKSRQANLSASNQVNYHFQAGCGVGTISVRNISNPFPKSIPSGHVIRVYDAVNIDGADDIALCIVYREFTQVTGEE